MKYLLNYNQIKELSNDKEFVKQIIQMFNKKVLRQSHVTSEECCKMIIDLIELGDKLQDEVKNTNVLDKENFDLFIVKYKVWIDFILGLDKKMTKLFAAHLAKNRTSIVQTDELVKVYNEFKRSKLALDDLYIGLSKYGIEFEKELITEKLNKDFDTYIISNNNKARIEKFCSHFDSTFVAFALKPMTKGFKTIQKMGKYKKDEMCMVGDQVMTDILGGNRFGCYTILVDPLGKKDLKITSFNRFLEKIVVKKLTKKGILERGKYYE